MEEFEIFLDRIPGIYSDFCISCSQIRLVFIMKYKIESDDCDLRCGRLNYPYIRGVIVGTERTKI